MHWVNFPLLTIMIWSGLRIYWANDVYDLSIGSWTFYEFFPDGFYEPLGLNRKLAKGMAWHFTFGWLFAINGVLYGLYTLVTGEWRHLVPDRRSIKESFLVLAHDLYLRKEAPPQGRYNAAQRLSYTGILILGAFAVLTGVAIYKPNQANLLTTIFGGYESARAIHFIITMAFIAFFVIHILQVIKAGWGNFFSMVTGYELDPKPKVTAVDGAADHGAVTTPDDGANDEQPENEQEADRV